MAMRIVGHREPDLDTIVSMLLVEAHLRVRGYKGKIVFSLIPQGSTYEDVVVSPGHKWEQVGEDKVWHVDVGRSLFDNHREGCKAPSSAAIINAVLRVCEDLPEWERLVKWTNEEEQGRLRCGCALPPIIRGMRRQLGPGKDAVIFRFARRAIEALLTNERCRVIGGEAEIEIVNDLLPLPVGGTVLRTMGIEGFGNVGLIVSERADLLGTYRNRLETGANVRLTISFDSERGHTGVMSCFSVSGEQVCLRELSIIQAIRLAEARARGLDLSTLGSATLASSGDVSGMRWFAYEADGKGITLLLNGSDKASLGEGEETQLSRQEIVKIVVGCVTASV